MEVFFDDEGVDRALAQFSRVEVQNLKVNENWRAGKKEYLSLLNEELQKRVNSPFRFEGTRGAVHSKGEAYFEVKKVKGWGWQKY